MKFHSLLFFKGKSRHLQKYFYLNPQEEICELCCSRTQQLTSYQCRGLLNELLAGEVCLHVHDNRSLFGVNFIFQFGIPDQVHDISLCLLRGHVELLGQHAEGDALVDATESLH